VPCNVYRMTTTFMIPDVTTLPGAIVTICAVLTVILDVIVLVGLARAIFRRP
jgi:hypothetical protein